MLTNILSKYSQSPYVLIGLELTDKPILKLLNLENSVEIGQIFSNINDCKDYIMKQINNEKIIFIISGHLFNDELIKLQNYSQIDVIYLYSKSDDDGEKLKCIYTKVNDSQYLQRLIDSFKVLWFLVGLATVLLLAYLFPHVGASGGPLYAEYSIKWGCVIIIFLFSSLLLSANHLVDELHNFRLHICIQISSLIVFPCIVYGIVLLLAKLSINTILLSGVILMACTPTAITINIIATEKAGGNLCATILNALFGNMIGVFISPLMISLFMKNSGFAVVKQSYDINSYTQVIGRLSLTALLPLCIGQIITRIWTEKILWAKEKFHFAELTSIALLILVWSVLCDLFQSDSLKTVNGFDLIIIIIFNTLFFIIFSLLILFIARLPNIFVCQKQIIKHDKQPLLLEYQSKQLTLIERWRFSRENTIAFIFCGPTKTLALGVPLIHAVFINNKHIGLLTLPLILYHVGQLILCSIAVMILKRWYKPEDNKQVIEQ